MVDWQSDFLLRHGGDERSVLVVVDHLLDDLDLLDLELGPLFELRDRVL